MNIPSKDNVVRILEDYFNVALEQVVGKRVFFEGKNNSGKKLVVCTPESKLHTGGFGWVDLTVKQLLILDKADYAVVAFRVEKNNVYYLNFYELKPYLSDKFMINNSREGDHWKLRIWQSYIEVIGNKKTLKVIPNDPKQLEDLK